MNYHPRLTINLLKLTVECRTRKLSEISDPNPWKMRRGFIQKNSFAFIFMVVSVSCSFILLLSVLRLPEIQLQSRVITSQRTTKFKKISENNGLGKFGEMMISMLPEDLAFTVFVPSEKAFERDLRLSVNDSFEGEKMNDTYAIVSRILGFSAVPRSIFSTSLDLGEEVDYDSLSGFALYISKDIDGMLFVNRVRSEMVDLRKGDIVIHMMDGVIMDAEFELSVQPDESEED